MFYLIRGLGGLPQTLLREREFRGGAGEPSSGRCDGKQSRNWTVLRQVAPVDTCQWFVIFLRHVLTRACFPAQFVLF